MNNSLILRFALAVCFVVHVDLCAAQRTFADSIQDIVFSCHACKINVSKADVTKLSLSIEPTPPYTAEQVVTHVSEDGKRLTIDSTSEKDTRVNFTLVLPIDHRLTTLGVRAASMSFNTLQAIDVASWNFKTATFHNSTILGEFMNLSIKSATIKSSTFRYIGPVCGSRILSYQCATIKSSQLFMPEGFSLQPRRGSSAPSFLLSEKSATGVLSKSFYSPTAAAPPT